MTAPTQQSYSIIITALTLLAAMSQASAALPLELGAQPMPSLSPLVREVSPAVVNIRVTSTVSPQRNPFGDDPLRRRFFGVPNNQPPRQVEGAGSGVIVDAKEGYIITNHHVVNGAEEIEVTLKDDRTLSAEVVGTDAATDIAVLKVKHDDLKALPFGNSDDLEVGDYVVAIGNPFGLGHTVTSGIVSALGRYGINAGTDQYEDFIQTDASINPGNSGGALVNLRGELIGINSAIFSSTGGNLGIGFAIPSNMTRSIMRQIVDFGEVRRGLLGVQIVTVNAENAAELGVKNVTGAVVMIVEPNSAADKAGIKVGDIVTAVNGKKIDTHLELRNSIGLLASGDKVKITLLRESKARTVTATLGDMAAAVSAANEQIHPGLDGARFANAAPASGGPGVLITQVEPGSRAEQNQLAAGDVILKVNQKPVTNVQELRTIAGDSRILWVLLKRGDVVGMRQLR